MTRTIVGAFDTLDEAQAAYRELEREGIPGGDISLIASNVHGEATMPGGLPDDAPAQLHDTGAGAARGAAAGGAVGGVAGLALSLASLAIPGVGPILAAGPIAAALGGASLGAIGGGILGGLTSAGVTEDDAHHYAEVVRRGGVLLLVRAPEHREAEATEVLRRKGAVDVAQRAERWRQEGWDRHDATAPPLTAAEIDRERERWRATGTTAGRPRDRS